MQNTDWKRMYWCTPVRAFKLSEAPCSGEWGGGVHTSHNRNDDESNMDMEQYVLFIVINLHGRSI